MRTPNPMRLIVIAACGIAGSAASGQIVGGTQTVTLAPGNNMPIFVYTNNSPLTICDFKLSTNNSDGIDPDFQGGPVTVNREPGTTNLMWTQSPPSADGVEDVKMKAPGIPDSCDACIPVGGMFSISMTFDGVGSGDILKITPTNKTGHEIMPNQSHQARLAYGFFEGYAEIQRDPTAVFSGRNATGLAILGIKFTSDETNVVRASSTRQHAFDDATATLSFERPVDPGELFDYVVGIDQLQEFVSGAFEEQFTEIFADAVTEDIRVCPCEVDRIDGIGVGDLLKYLEYYFAQDPRAERDDEDGIEVNDLLRFLGCYFTPTTSPNCRP